VSAGFGEGDDAPDLALVPRLVEGLTSPLVLLDELAGAARRAADGDDQSLGLVAELIAHTRRLKDDAPPPDHHDAGCCCGPCTDRRQPERREADATGGAVDDVVGEPDYAALDQTVLTQLLFDVAQLAMSKKLGSGVDARQAMDAVVSLALDAQLVVGLVDAYHTNGASGSLAVLNRAGQAGLLAWLTDVPAPVPVMQTMMGGAPGGVPGLPGGGLPGLPGGGLPGLPGVPKGPGTPVDEWLAALLKKFRKPKFWDPTIWDHKYPWWQDHPNWIDPATTKFIACLMAARRILNALSEPPPQPPAPPLLAVWNTGITRVTVGGPCAGETITITGSGFGATQPANTVLLLPTLDGCRVVAPASWSNTRITAVLPVRVASGPVGFGNKAYIDAYNAWVARMNELVAQLNGLFCQPIKRPLVPPFGMCPPSTAINTIRAGVAEIVAFTANNEGATVLDNGEPLTLRWTVRNAGTVTITRDTSGAPAFGGSGTLVTPLLTGSHAFGPVAHTGPAEWRYTLTITGACGGAVSRTVRVYTSKPPLLRIGALQVTQSIQTSTHAVKMVGSKPTVVRVLVQHGLGGWGGNTVPNVTGRIRMNRGGWSGWIDAAPANTRPMQATPGTSITVVGSPTLNTTTDTLNFMLPVSWASGTASYQVEVRVNGYGAVGGFAGHTEVVTRNTVSITYQRRRTLQFRYVRVNWNGAGAASVAQCIDTLRGAVPMLPTPTAGIAAVPGAGVENRTSGTSVAQIAAERRDMLDDFDDLHNCSFWEEITEWLGSDCPDEDGTIWVLIPGNFQRGEAYDIPSNVCYTPPTDGPYAAHELSHCLGQTHVRLPATGSNAPSGGDAASAWPNGAILADVPFDTAGTAGSGAGANPRALALTPGAGVADVMTYWGTPNNTWPMPERWDRLWTEIGG
jgi:hypothetical protein